jgi:site-specific DNA recombinase
MKKVVIYTRVSTDDQAANGFSLPHQFKRLNDFCLSMNWTVVKHFQDDYSAKTFDRPEYLKLEQFCKANKKDIDLVLFTRWDRFSRQCEFALAKIRIFQKMGIEVNACENYIDYSSPEHKIMLTIFLSNPEVENDKISLRTIEGSRRARIEGCWTGQAPFGYDNYRIGNKSSLRQNENSYVVKKAFELLSTGLYNAETIRRQFVSEGLFKLQKQTFLNLIRNTVYTGKICVKAYKKEDAEIVDGLHESIVSEELFYCVQKILNSRNRLSGKVKIKSEAFPLRGHLKCNICGGNLTASFSTSRNKDRHPYYHCQKGCKERFSANEAHKHFELLLSNLQFSDEIIELYKEIVKDIFSNSKGNKEAEIAKLKKEIEEKRTLLEAVEDSYFSKKIDDSNFKRVSTRYKDFIRDKLTSIENLKTVNTDSLKHFNYCLSLVRDLKKHYLESESNVRQKLVGSIFPEKIIYSEKKYRTSTTNSFFSLTSYIKKESLDIKNKKASISAGLSIKAPEAGLEPATL